MNNKPWRHLISHTRSMSALICEYWIIYKNSRQKKINTGIKNAEFRVL